MREDVLDSNVAWANVGVRHTYKPSFGELHCIYIYNWHMVPCPCTPNTMWIYRRSSFVVIVNTMQSGTKCLFKDYWCLYTQLLGLDPVSNWACRLAATFGSIILVPCHVVMSLQLTSISGTRRWNLWVPDLQISWLQQWLHLKIGHQGNNTSNGHQADMPYWSNMHPINFSAKRTSRWRVSDSTW